MTRGTNTKRRPWPPEKADLEALIEEAIVDAYGESEQRTGFYTMIEEHLGVPFEGEPNEYRRVGIAHLVLQTRP